jgi:hypothetical protein
MLNTEMVGTLEQKSVATPSLSRASVNVVVSWLVIATLGALEGMYGRTQYLGDWISYLNVSRAVSALNWRGIFDPMWNPCYPALVALVRLIFPHTAEGEWNAITLLNWLIFLMAYGSWRYLIRAAIAFYDPSLLRLRNNPVVLWTGCCAFLTSALCLDRVSNVCPDLLVTALFLLATAQTLSLLNRPSASRAVTLGMALGVGYWTKSVFLPFAGVFFLILILARSSKRLSWRLLTVSAFICLAMFASYGSAISWSYGQFTLGVSGPLNYAFHVNHLPHWTNWQGDPAVFGTPVHRTKQVVRDLPVFEFVAPFRTTYPPYNNMAYWYQGSRNSYSLKLQTLAIARSFYFLASIVKANPYLWALALALFAVALKRDWRVSLQAAVKRLWPLFLPAVLALAIYLAVHVEDRYLSAFCLIFSLLPLLPLLNPSLPSKRILVGFLLVIYTLGAAAELKAVDGPAFRSAMGRGDFHLDPQWKLSAALPAYGLQRGDTVAIIDDDNPVYRCHWAYVSDLTIVAEFGSLPWSLAPWDRTRFEHRISEAADEDYALLFWNKLSPERRAQVIDAFRDSGARAIVALSGPKATPEPGWKQIAGTNAWIYRFDAESRRE